MGTRRRRDGRQSGPRGGVWLRSVRGAMVLSAVALTAGTIALSPAARVSAATPSMTVSISPETARADVASSFAETYRANATLTNGTIRTVIPSGWTTPQTSNPAGPGYVTDARGTCTSLNATPSLSFLAGGAGTQVTVTGVTCAEGARLMLDYLDAEALRAGNSTFGPTTAQTSPSASAVSIPSPSVIVTAGPTTHFVVSSISSSTTAGSPYTFAVTPEDAGGDVSSYSGTVALSSSDTGSSTVLPPPTFIGGTHTFAATLTTAGVQSITATDTRAVPPITGTLSGITVSPAATALLVWSNVSAVSPAPAGGLPVGSPVNFTLGATDRYHNATPGYAGRVVFSSSTDPSALLPGAYTFAPTTDHGTHSFRFTPMKAGRETYTATDSHTTAITGSTIVPVNIAVGPETTANLTGSVGTPFSQSFTASGSTGAVSWTAGNLPSWLSLNRTTGIVSGTPMSTGDFGPFTITATDSASPADTGSWSYVVQVGQGAQTITITSTAPGAPYYGGPAYTPAGTATSGLPVTFRADPAANAVCTGTGTINFVGVGTCTVDADQGGNTTWAPAPEVQQSFSVSGATQTITLTSGAPANAVVHGSTYKPVASATSTLAVTFKVDVSSTAVCAISGGVVSFTSIGTCTIDAMQPGNDDWLGAPEVQQSFEVSGAPQTVSFTTAAPSDAVVDGATYSPAATTNAPGLTVALTVDDLSDAQCSIDGNGEVHFDHVGVCIIDANQGGDNETWAAAPQVQQSFSVGEGTQTIGFTSTAPGDAAVEGATYAPTAATNAPLLTVALTVDPASSAVCSMAADGTVSFTAIGTCTIDANQDGNSDWLPAAQAQQTFSVAGAPQTITIISSAPSAPYYQGPTYNPAGMASSGLPVTFSADPTTSAVCTGTGTISFVGVGTCTVDASQGGDATTWAAAPAVQQSFSVGQGTQTIGFTSTAPGDAVVDGPTYTPLTTSTSASDASAQPVIVSIDSSSGAVCALAADGSVSFKAIGTCTIDANQTGSANWSAATQVQQNFSVSGAPQTISFTSSAPNAPYDGGPGYVPTGTATSGLPVTFSADPSTSAVCTGTGTISFVGSGTCTVDANQGGDGVTYASASQVQQSFSVSGAVQTLSFTSNAPTDAIVNDSTYTPAASTTAPGLSVALTVDPSSSAVCSMAADGTVSFTAIGTCTLDANQDGDSEWLQATQVQQSFAVSGASQTITFTTSAPTNAVVGGTDYSPGASTSAPGLTVSLSVDSLATSVCSIDGNGNVSFTGVGVCIIDADQGGDGVTWAAAPQVQQIFSVGSGAPYLPSGTAITLSPGPTNFSVSVGVLLNSTFTAYAFDASDFVDPAGGSYAAGTLSFQWVISYSDAPAVPYTDVGITGTRSPVLQISKEALMQTTTTITATITLSVQSGVNPAGLTVVTIPIMVQNGDLDLPTYNQCQNLTTLSECPVPEALPPGTGMDPQTLSFTSNAPAYADVNGATYRPVATSTSSFDPTAEPVTLSVDPASSAVCSMDSGGTVSFTAIGTCTIDANQGGSTNWQAAPQAQQSFTVGPYPQVTVTTVEDTNPADNIVQTPVLPPDPGINSCPKQQFPDGGCQINDLDGAGNGYITGSGDNYLAATVPGVPAADVTYHWQVFYPPIFGIPGVVFSDAGITGYNSQVLHIAAGSLPQLVGDKKAGGDPYWRVLLTTTINGASREVWFRFIYDSNFPLDFSTNCQLFGQFMGLVCWSVASQLLPSPGLGPGDNLAQSVAFTSSSPTNAVVGGPSYTPSASVDSGMPLTYSVDPTAASVCSMASDGSVSYIGAGTCTIDADQQGSPDYVPAEAQQSFQVGVQTISFTSTAPLDVPVGGTNYVPTATTTAPGLTVSFSIDLSSRAVCSMSGGVVSFTAVGTCRIDAAQAGDPDWLPATQYQSFEIGETGPGSQTITFTSEPPLGADTGGVSYTPQATSTSAADTTAQPVTLSVAGSTSSVCTMKANGSVSFTAAGTCTIDANQAGNAYWSAASQVQQSFTVTQTLAPTLKINVDYPQGNPQNPVLPPNPAANQCAPQTAAGGGCTINALNPAVVNEFDASIASDPNPNPAEDTTTYKWQFFSTSGAAIVPFQPTVFTSSQLLLPALALQGDDVHVELTATTNGGPSTSVFFSVALTAS